ncbi:Histone superfamily protein [Perilla frutescens var. frutescens]|nr:Histone superfamily protein [Perilla frutescens var. frutescens]
MILATNDYIVKLFAEVMLCAIHAKRLTLVSMWTAPHGKSLTKKTLQNTLSKNHVDEWWPGKNFQKTRGLADAAAQHFGFTSF